MRTKRFRSGLSGFLFGGLWGGIVGTIVFGLLTYFDDSSYLLGGATRNWTLVSMGFGLVCGLIVGSILGAVIGTFQADRRTGIIIGGAIGLFIVALTEDIFVIAIIVSCSILGLIISGILQGRERLG